MSLYEAVLEVGTNIADPAERDSAVRSLIAGAPSPNGASFASFASEAWPTLGDAAMHGLAGDVVNTLLPHTEADRVGLLLGFLTMYGNAVGSGPHVRVSADQHPARLFTLQVGKTASARKGTAAGMVREPMRSADGGWSERIMSGFGSGEAVVDAVRDPDDDHDGIADKRLLVREGEFARLLKVASRDGSVLSSIIRDAWDGARLQVRTRKQTAVATGAHVSVLADITVEELRRELSDTEIANGWANRYLYVLVKGSKRLPSGGNLDDQIVADLGKQIATKLTVARKVGRMHRDPKADERWCEWYNAVDLDRGGLYGAVTARAEAQALRLSVVYALLEGSNEIRLEHLEAAIAVWDYADASARIIFGDMLGDPYADKLLGALRDAGGTGLDGTEQSALFGRHLSADTLQAVRQRLEVRGLAVTDTEHTNGRDRLVTRIAKQAN